jgi:cytochrome P450
MCPHDSQCWHGAAADVADQMPYVDAVIKETIRLYDPATVLFRRALEDILVDGNLVIPKVRGSSHCAMQLFTHRARGMGGLGQRVYCPSVISLYA